MKPFSWATIGAYWDPSDRYAPYYREALEHAGVPFTQLDSLAAAVLAEVNVLLLCGYGDLSELATQAVDSWVHKGGVLVCSGSSWGLAKLLGIAPGLKHVSRAKILKKEGERCWPQWAGDTLFFGGESASIGGTSRVALETSDRRVLASRRSFAKGKALFFGAHVGQTLCQMQLGRSVEVDAPGAEDGSAQLDDGVLRAEDGASLELERDRKKVEGSPTPAFLDPHSDVVRECWLRIVFEAVEASGKAIAVPWYWPHNAEGASMLSVDCKVYREDLVHRLQRVLGMYGCRPAWLVSLPGFSLDVYRGLRKWEQEVGLLFTVEEGMSWHEERMKIQQAALSRAAGISDMVAVRADEGRWQGWLDFYAMCEGSGARISLSKGGRQPGTSGFLFGTCHPFFPLKRDGSPFLAAELPYLVFMPGIETPIPVAEAVLERAVQANGAYQVTLDLSMKGIEEAVDAVRRLLAVSKQKRMEFMKPGDVYRFEKARRNLRIFLKATGDQGAMTLVSDQEVEGLSILFAGIPVAARSQGRAVSLQTVERFGTKMRALTVNLEARQQHDIALAHSEEELAA